MSLYDDDDDIIEKSNPTGWAKPSIKPAAPFAAPLATAISPSVAGLNRPKPLNAAPRSLPPVINLQKPKRPSTASPFQSSPASGGRASVDYDDVPTPTKTFTYGGSGDKYSGSSRLPLKDPNWTSVNEYDPLWPNDYYKVAGEIKDARRQQRAAERAAAAAAADEEEAEDAKRRKSSDGGSRDNGRDRETASASGFGMRPKGFGDDDYSDEEEEKSTRGGGGGGGGRGRSGAGGGGGGSGGSSGGAAIAPPPSLTASSSPSPDVGPRMHKLAAKSTGLGFAAKLMAKFGYKVSCIDFDLMFFYEFDLTNPTLARHAFRKVKVSAGMGRECRRLSRWRRRRSAVVASSTRRT